MGPIGRPETWIRKYNYLLRNNDPEERTFQLLRGGSLRSRMLAAALIRLVLTDIELVLGVTWGGGGGKNPFQYFFSPGNRPFLVIY